MQKEAERSAMEASAERAVLRLGIGFLSPETATFEEAAAAWRLERSVRTAVILGAAQGRATPAWAEKLRTETGKPPHPSGLGSTRNTTARMPKRCSPQQTLRRPRNRPPVGPTREWGSRGVFVAAR